MDSSLYREEIIEHYKSPLNFGKPSSFDASSTELNPFCGDEISLFIKYNKDTISEVGFTGKGCALSIAGASMLTDFVKEKKISSLTKFSDADMLNLLGVDVSETRKKCALLALYTLRDCLNN